MGAASRGLGSRRRFGLVAVALVAAALVPAALALACNPQAYLTLDKTQYAPGDSVRVSGSFFRGDANVTVSIDRVGLSTTVRTTANGAFSTSFALPANAPSGGYSVSAIGFEPNGDVVAGLPARGSFSVAAAAASAPAGSGDGGGSGAGAQTAAPQASVAQQPAAPAATRPTARAPQSGAGGSSFREPGVLREPDVQASSPRSGRAVQRAAAGDGAERASAGGRAVFGGSVAPAVSAAPVTAAAAPSAQVASRPDRAAASRSAGASARVGSQAAEQTATDDVWGALSPGRSPSVLPVAGDGVAVSSPDGGSQLALGILLLGVGALALVGGLAAGEARRRRVRAR